MSPRLRTSPKALHRLLINIDIDGRRPLSTPQRPLSLRGGNRCSCPLAVILLHWSRLSPLGCKAVVRFRPIVARGMPFADRRRRAGHHRAALWRRRYSIRSIRAWSPDRVRTSRSGPLACSALNRRRAVLNALRASPSAAPRVARRGSPAPIGSRNGSSIPC